MDVSLSLRGWKIKFFWKFAVIRPYVDWLGAPLAPGRPTRGGGVTPPARLLRLHRHSLVNVLVVGGSPEQRVQVAYTFHKESVMKSGPFVCLDGNHDHDRLRRALQFWTLRLGEPSATDPIRAAQRGTVTNLQATSDSYQWSANHDPDTDSDGTTITVARP